MTEVKGYVLGQSARAARRLEIQDAHFADTSERLLDDLALSGAARPRGRDRLRPGGFSRRILRRLGTAAFSLVWDSERGLLSRRARRG